MKQEDRFFRLMHAVDDDLLEEAMQPVRRRRHVWIPLAAAACLCIAAALAAVPLLRAPARQDVQPDGTQKQSGTSATEAAVPSSITTDAKAIMDLGYTLAVPADSQDVVYSLVPTDSDIPMAQVCYVSNGIRYTARSLKTDSAADLTGSSANWTQELSWSDAGLAMDLRTDGEESWVGWYAGSTGTQWALGAEDSAQSVLHSACGILKTLGYDVAVAPDDAEDVTYGVLEIDGRSVRSVVLGDIDLHKLSDPYVKLRYIFERVGALIDQYAPREVALESPFFGENVQSMLKLGRAQGVAMAAALSRGLPVSEYAPMRIKQSITGRGSAAKEQVAAIVCRILSLEQPPKRLDATDGMAVALCHHFTISNPLNAAMGNERVKGLGGGKKAVSKGGSQSWEKFLREHPDREIK